MKSWDIFCRVIDNYGDIGVCWRLARQLANEYPFQIRLFVDELAALKMIWPETELIRHQTLAKVEVHHWTEDFLDTKPADVVIEAFACDIPQSYIATMELMKSKGQAPVWINLDYLSAEPWVEDCHKMQSIQPASGLRKTFFFPGFTDKTGGLIREKDITSTPRVTPLANPPYDPPNFDTPLLVSLFAYENQAVASLIEAWQKGPQKIHCLIPQGRAMKSINPLLASPLVAGQPQALGALTLETIPFMNQLEYDQLLKRCDLNFVRGEDSLVRAIWAGTPFVWQIYPQEEDAHLVKLEAFLEQYTQAMPDELKQSIKHFWLSWNKQQSVFDDWNRLNQYFNQWVSGNSEWRLLQVKRKDLVGQLVEFVGNSTV